jgi:hypothetical protein
MQLVVVIISLIAFSSYHDQQQILQLHDPKIFTNIDPTPGRKKVHYIQRECVNGIYSSTRKINNNKYNAKAFYDLDRASSSLLEYESVSFVHLLAGLPAKYTFAERCRKTA